MRLPSVMKHDFSKAPQAVIPRSSFNRSHGYKTTFDAGYLIPFFRDEVIPGDTHHLNTTVFVRAATFLFPLMDNIHIDIQYFFIPMRILWDNFEKFMGFQKNPGDSISYVFPTVTSDGVTGFTEGSPFDYLGVSTKVPNQTINVMLLRAMNKCYNDWYRDENLQNSVSEHTDDGPDPVTDYNLLRRGKRHDYFTSSLPTPQKGPSVPLPLGTIAPVIPASSGAYPTWNSAIGLPDNFNFAGTSGTQLIQNASGNFSDATNIVWNTSGLVADLATATAANINDLRLSITVQRQYERFMRGGTRYQEVLWSSYGVHGGDSRLQRSELLSTYSQNMNINVVSQTSGTGQTGQLTPLANLAGFGTAVCHKAGFVKSFVEHGYILGFISARADLTYQNGTDRLFYTSTRFDLYWPEFANIGEMAVLQREIFTSGTSADIGVWGYQEPWAWYRYKQSLVTGLFRTNASGSLDSWHLAQDLSTPALNATFIVDNPPMTRVKATSGDPDFICDVYHHYISARPLPMYSVPGLTRL